jgi:mercuric ion binding protein
VKDTLGILVLAIILGSGSHPAVAADRTATLRVMHMTCALCPLIVRKAIEAVPGVKQIDVSMEAGTATVVYNDVATNPTELAEAIVNAGYPAWPSER